ncbi:MAG: guanylate kinase [Moorea sp. SIO2B7]|nr:guanylate kinase [Moorena sp. SIO2B7]
MQAGKLIVLTGPSGVGKGTLVRSLLARHPQIYLSVSATTRKPRSGEIEGRDYYFITRQEFDAMINNGQLLEWAEYAGNYYGTPCQKVEQQINQGQLVLLEIEVLGARKIKQTFPDALRLFILPPSLEELERRLRGRGNDSEEAIIRRLKRAKEELAASDEFDIQIINDDLGNAIAKIEAAIFLT